MLFILADDMQPLLSAYGHRQMHTPHLDKLADEGVLFKRAYAQYPMCGPSRASLLTGRRPDTTLDFSYSSSFRKKGVGMSWVTLPEHFRKHGYTTLAAGPVFHPGLPVNFDATDTTGRKRSWDRYEANQCHSNALVGEEAADGFPRTEGNPGNVRCHDHELMAVACPVRNKMPLRKKHFHPLKFKTNCWLRGTCEPVPGHTGQLADDGEDPSAPAPLVPKRDWCVLSDKYMHKHNLTGDSDDATVRRVIAMLHEVAQDTSKPWFIAAGLTRTHGQWLSRKRYYDYYPLESIELPRYPDRPKGLPAALYDSWHMIFDWENHTDMNGVDTLPENKTKEYRRAYYAAVTALDADVGHILRSVEQYGLQDTTAVVFTSDHGFALGENNQWGKNGPWETTSRVPLIISVPWFNHWFKRSSGFQVNTPVELVSLYQTLTDVMGLPTPYGLDGKSFSSLVTEPHEVNKDAMAFTQRLYEGYPSGNRSADKTYTKAVFAVRNFKYTYLEWVHLRTDKHSILRVDLQNNKRIEKELYTTLGDENSVVIEFDTNLVTVPDSAGTHYSDEVSKLSKLLRDHFSTYFEFAHEDEEATFSNIIDVDAPAMQPSRIGPGRSDRFWDDR